MNINDITITSLETITAFELGTGSFLFALDELQSATIAQTQESQEVTGKQGRKLTSLKRNKAVTVSGNNGLVSGGLLELQTGGKFENKATEVRWVEYRTVSASGENAAKVQLAYTPVGTTGNEIDAVYIKDSNGAIATKLKQADSITNGNFKYDPETNTLEFSAADISEDKEIVVYYDRKIVANVLENVSDNYSGKCALYVDAFAEDKCSNVYRVQFYIPKADFNGEFSFEMGDNQTVHAFEAEALAGACGMGGALWTYTIFGENTADEVAGA